jgi:glucose-1-phosphate thymidylyltransferase
MTAAEYSLIAMREAGVRRCAMITSARKLEVLHYFGSGSDLGLSICYVVQPEPLGLASAVDAAYDWIEGCDVCLALPDTVFRPRGALGVVTETLTRSEADLVLGVFPTASPEQLGPVLTGAGGRVLDVLEKPPKTDLRNTWGVAAWTPSFTSFLHKSSQALAGLSIGCVFRDAVREGFYVSAVRFDDGSYVDIGTAKSLADIVIGPQGEGNASEEALLSSAGCGSVG